MVGATLLRRIASLLLVLCFVLPLTKCSVKQEVAGSTQSITKTTFTYGYQMVADNAAEAAAGDLEKIVPVALLLVAFFAPLAMWALRDPWCSSALFLAAIPSLYTISVLSFLGDPQIGGLLALGCWLVLLMLSAFGLRLWLRERKSRRKT